MEVRELKRYLLEETDRITKVLETAGFHDIWINGNDELRCALPDGDNKTSVVVKLNENLYTTIYSSDFSGDLIGAVQKVTNSSFKDAMGLIHACLGLSNKFKGKKLIDPLSIIKEYTKKGNRIHKIENKKYNKSYLDRFANGIHKSVIEEGILPSVAREFDIRFDAEKSRIIFPHYDWNETDKIVGVKGRTTLDSELAKELDVPKYWNYIKGYSKMNNLYGYNMAKDNINRQNKMILFEGEKSVLKQFTYENHKGYSVALGGHVLSDEQVSFILKNTGIDCEIIIAYDKDVMSNSGDEDLGEKYLISECKKFIGMRKVSYIYDSHDLLEDNSSPIDEGKVKWDYLFKWRKFQ
ncbi:primase [Liquorilactobacillus mali]|uniref:DNA primase n=1 Tax=Liquorilactobacillus mali KCTC 3596 = DSM 20444 TaxID=1046596 RepID=A0A0R2EA62_9LACO|nr:primase [Liquorilactobacillus mali]KRN10853.1 hypothetical protein FD00_GL002096 [Liquorilactobacillus mali KCTC 3596 = DSM 20444]